MRRFLRHGKGLHKVRYYGLWRWSRREHAAQARLGRAHAPISLDRADDDPRHWDLSFISKCWLNTSVRLFFIERSLDTLPLVFI
ncbi:MAG: hypothetical protein WAM17_06140 [Rhodoplanes sp.]